MSKTTIKIIVSLGVVALLTLVYFVSGSNKQNQGQQTISPTPTSTAREPEVSVPVDRQERIDHVLATKGKDYRRYSLTKDGPKNLIITYYQINLKNLQTEDVELRRHQKGILVFEEKKIGEIELIWESMDDVAATRPILGVYDLTGEGVNEIIALWQYDKVDDLYIYKQNKDDFEMITPYFEHVRSDGGVFKYIGFNAEENLIKIFDVDKDGIPEIVFPFTLGSKEKGEVYRAYKWDGSKYYLWKEQKESFTPSTRADEYSVASVLYQPKKQ